MARSKSRSRSRNTPSHRSPRRDVMTIASPLTRFPMTDVEDSRLWTSLSTPPLTIRARRASVKHGFLNKPFSMAKVYHQLPKQAVVCVRRKIRKEVLFAKGFGGSGAPRRKPHFNDNSTYRC